LANDPAPLAAIGTTTTVLIRLNNDDETSVVVSKLETNHLKNVLESEKLADKLAGTQVALSFCDVVGATHIGKRHLCF
jgi:class 3 adenylate cyclase